MKVLLVANPTAQSGRNAARIERAVSWLRSFEVPCEVLHTLPGGETIDAVSNKVRAGSYSVVAYMGGDGTFREVAAGLLYSGKARETPLGMLPTGTANDQGRSFGLDSGDAAMEKNLRTMVLTGRRVGLDAGRIRTSGDMDLTYDNDVFFDSAGWGMSAKILAARNEDREWVSKVEVLKDVWRDQLVYAGAALRTFLESYVVDHKFDADVTVDGRVHRLRGLTDLVVKGTKVYAGAWVLDPTSRPDDGKFEVVPFYGKPDWLAKAIVNLDGMPVQEDIQDALEDWKPLRGSCVEIRFLNTPESGHFAQIDGEEFPSSSAVDVSVEREAISIVVP